MGVTAHFRMPPRTRRGHQDARVEDAGRVELGPGRRERGAEGFGALAGGPRHMVAPDGVMVRDRAALGDHRVRGLGEYNGQLAVFDLYHDPDEFWHLSAERLVSVLNTNPKVIRSLRANAQPILMPADAAPEEVKALQISPEERQRRVDVIREDANFRGRVGQALALRFADQEPSPHVEKRIYDGFPGLNDQSLMEQFHRVDWVERAAIAEQIEDPRISEFAYRLIYFERRDVLPSAKTAELESWVAERVLTEDENVPWMTVAKALRETDNLLIGATDDDARLLGAVKDFLYQLANQLESN